MKDKNIAEAEKLIYLIQDEIDKYISTNRKPPNVILVDEATYITIKRYANEVFPRLSPLFIENCFDRVDTLFGLPLAVFYGVKGRVLKVF